MAKNKKVEISVEEKLEKALVPVEEQPYKIPNNWVWARYDVLFSDISKNEKKIDEKNYLENGEIAIISQGKNEIVGYSNILKVKPYMEELPLVIFGEHTLNVKYIEFPFYIGADGVKVLKTTDIAIPKFLFYLINNLKTYSLINTGYRRHYPILKKLFFPLAPLEEQKRIVEKLDFLFDKTKKAKEIIEEIKIDIENRKISILDRAFKGVLTSKWRNENKTSDVRELLKSINDEKIKKWEEDCLQAEKDGNKKPKKPIIREIKDMIVPVEEQPYKIPDSWVWVRLGDIYNLFTGNSIPESEKTIKYINLSNGYKYIATKDISYDGEINYENGVIIPYNEEKFKVAKANSSLLCIEGGSAGRKAGIVDRDVCFVNKLCCFESNSNLESKIIYYYIKSENFLSLFRESMNGLIGGVSLNNLKKIEFPLPPLEEQQEIVRILDEVLENENKVKELLELEERIDILEKSILNKAFKGELGTQNSSDKSAIELLKISECRL